MSIFSKEPAKNKRKLEGIAKATTEGLAAIVEHFKLPQVEAMKVFATAYATALAKTVGEDPEEMFGDQLEVVRNWKD